MPRTLSFRQFCADPRSVLDEVCASDEPVIVKRSGCRDVVILSQADYEALEETVHLLSSPANAKRLRGALHRDPSAYVPVSVEELRRMVEDR